jgi:hypothetical protein
VGERFESESDDRRSEDAYGHGAGDPYVDHGDAPREGAEAPDPYVPELEERPRLEREPRAEVSREEAEERAERQGAADVGERLRERFPPESWEQGDLDARRQWMEGAGSEIASSYGVDERPLFADPELKENQSGYATRDVVAYNPDILESSSPEDAVRTLAHEYEHELQYDVIDGKREDPLRSDRLDRRDEWRDGEARYEDDIGKMPFDGGVAYEANPLERDAFAVEHVVWRGYSEGRERRAAS